MPSVGIDTVTVRPTKEILLEVCASRECQRQADDDNLAKQNRAAQARMPGRERARRWQSASRSRSSRPSAPRLSRRRVLGRLFSRAVDVAVAFIESRLGG